MLPITILENKKEGISISKNAKKFLALFSQTIFTYIPDNNDKLPVIHSERLDLEQQRSEYGIFFTINGFAGGKRDSAHLTSLNAFFCDIDFPDKKNRDPEKIRLYKNDLAMELHNLDMLPTAMVETKNGLHVYWIFKQPILLKEYNDEQREKILKSYRQVEEAILDRFDGDPAAKDTARVLRVPETWHQKDANDPFLCKLIFFSDENTYTFDYLASKFLERPTDEHEHWAEANSEGEIDDTVRKQIEERYPKLERPSYQQLLKKTAPIPEGMRNRALLVAAAACCLGGWDIEKTYKHFETFYGLSIREIRKTIKSAYRHPYDFGSKNEIIGLLQTQEERAKLSSVASDLVTKKLKKEKAADKETQNKMYEEYERIIAERYPHLKYKYRADFYLYDHGVYQLKQFDEIRSLFLREMASDGLYSFRKISSTNDKIACFKSLPERGFAHGEENPNPNIINLKNGLLDFSTFTMSDHTPMYLSTVQIPVEYSASARCPLWNAFLREIMDNDEEQISLLQQIAGYALTNDTTAQKAFIFLGHHGGNGKGVFNRTLSKLVGKENVSNLKLTDITRRFGLTGLIGKRLNIVDEISGNYFESDIIKSVISGDPMTAEIKFRPEPIDFVPLCKLIFAVNELPRINDTSQALYRRFIIIPFLRTFQMAPDPNLEQKLEAELSGILNWAIEGLKILRKNDNRFTEYEKNRSAMLKFKEENSPLVEFLLTSYEPIPEKVDMFKFELPIGKIYTEYQNFCRDMGYKTKSCSSFAKELENLSYDGFKLMKTKKQGRMVVFGMRPLKSFHGDPIAY